jgi:hypothetical protein
VGPLSRIPWSFRAFTFALLVLGFGLVFGFDWWLAVGALVGVWIGLSQWRRRRPSARL